ncbi:hypothetical protein CAEBREN_17561 [Caenorhabditis brenneri]|uniref:Uncharacterized protein n=1 Tax=Caenorhabditis brenneri TaxID=135651 RepID=G0N1N1_CAEBE|nr:hypothetical protein CAEBREN_17561 [Caenorhabditis brenneri]
MTMEVEETKKMKEERKEWGGYTMEVEQEQARNQKAEEVLLQDENM